jgi:UMF1 family MFS transporter
MVTMPSLGAYADLRAAKKRLLALVTLGCVVCTAALALRSRARWPWRCCW